MAEMVCGHLSTSVIKQVPPIKSQYDNSVQTHKHHMNLLQEVANILKPYLGSPLLKEHLNIVATSSNMINIEDIPLDGPDHT